MHTHTHTYTFENMDIYTNVCVCVLVCICVILKYDDHAALTPTFFQNKAYGYRVILWCQKVFYINQKVFCIYRVILR